VIAQLASATVAPVLDVAALITPQQARSS